MNWKCSLVRLKLLLRKIERKKGSSVLAAEKTNESNFRGIGRPITRNHKFRWMCALMLGPIDFDISCCLRIRRIRRRCRCLTSSFWCCHRSNCSDKWISHNKSYCAAIDRTLRSFQLNEHQLAVIRLPSLSPRLFSFLHFFALSISFVGFLTHRTQMNSARINKKKCAHFDDDVKNKAEKKNSNVSIECGCQW